METVRWSSQFQAKNNRSLDGGADGNIDELAQIARKQDIALLTGARMETYRAGWAPGPSTYRSLDGVRVFPPGLI